MYKLGKIKRIPVMHEFEWRIPNFASFLDKGCQSPEFSFTGESWELSIFPRVAIEKQGIYISLFLRRIAPACPISLEVTLGLKTSSGKKYSETKFTQPYIMESDFETFGTDRFLLRSQLLEKDAVLLPSKVLTVFCALKNLTSMEDENEIETAKCSHCKDSVDIKNIPTHEKKCVNKPIKCPECSDVIKLKDWYYHDCQLSKDQPSVSASSIVLPENELQHDLKEFFLRKEDCDVVIKVQGQEFPAHKAILQARSPVFASTFRNDMKEKASGIVDIEDCEASTFSDFLCFIYCGNIEVLSHENAFSLFTAADKYDVKDLRALCLKFIKETLSLDSFCDTMTLALRHSETELFMLATDFFIKNAPKIIVTVKWQTFAAEYPTQSNELFIKLLVPDNSLTK